MIGKRADQRTRRRKRATAPTFQGWHSTDEEEIKRRQWRGRTEIAEVRPVDAENGPFCDYTVTSSSGNSYTVEIRSIRERINSCGRPDHRTNRLGTCKHIEGALRRLTRRVRSREVSGRIEVFLDERDSRSLRLSVPESLARDNPVLVAEVERHFDELHQGSSAALAALRGIARENAHSLRVSHRLESWVAALQSESERRLERARFEDDLKAGRRSMDMLKLPLLPYQIEGAMHLAFGERALLADDMGPRQDRAGCCGLRPAARVARGRTGARGLARLTQGRVEGTDCPLLRPVGHFGLRQLPGPERRLCEGVVLHPLQLRAGGRRRGVRCSIPLRPMW